ncbi:MAG: sigma-70 family RNA polymerase sigma factor [Bacteroidales bacterium]|nr:sigma-70 family RNA polymerase sigma factor [Bacteroidales bacterium]
MAVNTAIDAYRKNARKPDYQDIEYVQAVDVSEDVISSMSAEEILNMVRRLSPAYRTVFTLFVIDGYTHREIAEKLGVTEGTSKSNLQDARKRLQSMILRSNTIYNTAYELKTLPADEN